MKRRQLLIFLGAGAATAVGAGLLSRQKFPMPFSTSTPESGLSFQPVRGPMPLDTEGLSAAQQIEAYRRYTVVDDLLLPEAMTYDVIAAWGDPVGQERFGYNNDYLSFVPSGPDQGYLSINFEYVSAVPWMQTYEQVIGESLPFAAVQQALKSAGEKGINAYALAEDDPLKLQIQAIAIAALRDQGLGVIQIRKTATGGWERTNAAEDRRISGISGLRDGRYLQVSGPAAAVFRKQGQGYQDGLGDRVIGTFGNCAGGTTPWGTVLSAEENFQIQVPEPVYADGTSFGPEARPFTIDEEELSGQGNVLGLAGNKYGWIVEVDPANPEDRGTKHSWLGRYRHEAVGVRVEVGKPLAFYSGCDRRGGHLYKFVSAAAVQSPTDKANSGLLAEGMLYAAQFNPDGTGRWIPLQPETPIDPTPPSAIAGNLLALPKRPEGGIFKAETDAEVAAFKQQFATLDALYSGNPEEKQGAILIDAHFAANAVGATCTARPEDTVIGPDGSLYIAFTSGVSGGDGGPDQRIFKGPNGETEYEYGFIMRLMETQGDPAALSFNWQLLALGGEPAQGGAGFANPDNLAIDAGGNLWMVTDMSSGAMNKAIPARTDAEGKTLKQTKLRGLFGNNAIWFIPTSGENAGNAYLFGIGPMDCEVTGPCFTPDQQTLFLAVQHPGEVNGIRKDGAAEDREFAMLTTDGQPFSQTRSVPIGSNWPGKQPNDPPKPAVVAVRRRDQQALTSAT